jgi:hypothetical protein
MVRVAILPVPTAAGTMAYRAVAGDKQSEGKTAGEALDALTRQLRDDENTALVIVQSLHPDQFFQAGEQARLAELMARWREARDSGTALPAAEQTELEALIDEEARASARRTAAWLDELTR